MKTSSLIFCSFSLALALGFLAIRLAPMLRLLDVPGGRRQHGAPVPRVGGLALISALLIISFLRGFYLPMTNLEFVLVLVMAITGLVDDLTDLRPVWKASLGLFVALVLAGSLVSSLHAGLAPFKVFLFLVPPAPWLVFTLLALFFWSIPQALNLIDGANGLATGFGLVVVGNLWASGSPHPMLAGTLAACLLLNWPRARLFLGDCGSLSLGLLLVIYAEKRLLIPNPNHLLWLFAYPIADVLMVIIIRLIQSKPVFIGDRNHLHYQLIDRWPKYIWGPVPMLLTIAALCGSEIYLTGPWLILPYSGLAMLFIFTSSTIFLSVKEKEAERPGKARAITHELGYMNSLSGLAKGTRFGRDPFAPAEKISSPDELPPDPSLKHLARQGPALEGRVEALALHEGAVNVDLGTQVHEREIAG